MKTLILCFITTVVCQVWLAGCGGKADYNDFIQVNTQFIEAMDENTSDLETAGDALEVADAMDYFAERMETIVPELKQLRGKYPELGDASKMPEEVRAINEKNQQIVKRLPQTLSNAMRYMKDPGVMAAMQRLPQAMSGMQ